MKIYWFGAKSISQVENIPLEEAKKIWDRACFESRNMKTAIAGLFVILALITINSYLGQINFGDVNITIFWQLVVLVTGLVILAQMNFLLANYKVNQSLKPNQKRRF